MKKQDPVSHYVSDDEDGLIIFQNTNNVSKAKLSSTPQDVNEATNLKVYFQCIQDHGRFRTRKGHPS
jgi:hypothetical protein